MGILQIFDLNCSEISGRRLTGNLTMWIEI